MPKLYRVDVDFTFYAYTDTPDAAEDFAQEALNDSYLSSHTRAVEVQYSDSPIFGDWDEKCLVYHADKGDIMLGEVMQYLPKRPKGR